MSDTFFVPDGDAFIATPHTRGPWSAQHQHGGPPAALLVRAVEQWRARDGGLAANETAALASQEAFVIARASLELLRPVPITRLEVTLDVERLGRRVATFRVALRALGDVVAIARVLCIRAQAFEVPVAQDAAGPSLQRGPETGVSWVLPFSPAPVGYHTAIESRVVEGAFASGHMGAWMRPRIPLLPDEPMTGVQRALLFADAGHGLSAPLDFARHTFINPDLNVAFHREPVGEWLWLDARTFVEPTGVGLVRTLLADTQGPCGHASQSLVLATRDPAPKG